jgi:hypothetical protein
MAATAVALLLALSPMAPRAQTGARRLTTIDALRQFPGFFHLQNVLLRGRFEESGRRVVLRSDAHEIGTQLADGVTTRSGDVEVRAQLIDVGRLEPGDPRLGGPDTPRESDRWPRPGEELILRVTAVADAPPSVSAASVRSLALEPWRYAGQSVTVTGNFRGRNLFGDLPDGPAKGRYDFVIRASDAAVWVTGLRPRGRGFDLDVDRRLDSNRWVEVTGSVAHDRGLVRLEAARMSVVPAPTETRSDEPEAVVAPPPVEVVFSTPADGDTDASPGGTVRVQFSRGLSEPTLAGRVVASYAGAAPGTPDAAIPLSVAYDAANRAIEIKFTRPLEAFRTVTVRLLDGITAFDRGPLRPWSVGFSVRTP